MKWTTIFFDLDDTLYPAECGLWEEIKTRISLYMHEILHLSWDEIPALREKYFKEYGTTLRGLQRDFDVDEDAYLAYVHNLPLDVYLSPDLRLRSVLTRLPQRKYIFTNADTAHARRVLRVMDLEDAFDGILGVHEISPYIKPQPDSFLKAMRLAGEEDPRRCVMIDDIPRTVRAARQVGFLGILKHGGDCPDDVDACLSDWATLPAILENGRKA